MFSKIALTTSTILALTFVANAAQAGYVYYPNDEYVVHHRRHVVVEETEGYQQHHRHGYYQKKVLINEHPTYQTCHYITSWDAEGHPLPVEDCK